jgi:hypothetical protein
MKKLTLAAALFGGMALAGAGSASAADWNHGGYRVEPVRHVQPVRYVQPVRRESYPSVTRRYDDCFTPPARRYEPVYDYRRYDDRRDSDWSRHDDHYRYPVVQQHKGYGFNGLGLNFWYGR